MGASEFGLAIGRIGVARRERDDRNKKEREEEDKKAKKQGYADMMGKKYGPEFQTAIEAGEDISDLVKLREAAAKRASGSGGGGGRYPKDPFEQFDMARGYFDKAQGMLTQAGDQVYAAQQSGDPAQIEQAMSQYNAIYDATEGVKGKIEIIGTKLQSSSVMTMQQKLQEKLADMHPDKVSLMSETLNGVIEKKMGGSREMMQKLEEAKDMYGLDIDLSGIPDYNSVSKFAWRGIMQKELDEESVDAILASDDPDDLLEIANDKNRPESQRVLAMAAAKSLTAVNHFMPDIKKNMGMKKDEELDQILKNPAKNRIQEAVQGEAQEEKKKRNTKAYLERTKSRQQKWGGLGVVKPEGIN